MRVSTRLHCDGVRWLAWEGWEEHLVASLYETSEAGVRSGGLELYRLEEGSESLRLAQSLALDVGVFRLPGGAVGPELLLPLTDGSVGLVRRAAEEAQPRLSQDLPRLPASEGVTTCVLRTGPTSAVAGDDGGRLSRLDLESGQRTAQGSAHRLVMCKGAVVEAAEVWALEALGGAVLASGGEDGLVKLWDERTEASAAVGTSGSHGAGVTALLWAGGLGWGSEALLSGSYDERVRAWDRRALGEPLWKSARLGGGVWELCPHPREPRTLAMALMQAGWARAAVRSDGLGPVDLVASPAAEPLLYGLHFHPTRELIVTADFYDNALSLHRL